LALETNGLGTKTKKVTTETARLRRLSVGYSTKGSVTGTMPRRAKSQRPPRQPGNCATHGEKAAKMLLTAIAQLPSPPTDMARKVSFAKVVSAKNR
jgi:hypothetical protein